MYQCYRNVCMAAGAAFVLAVTGCGGTAKVYPVKGKITFEGKPMKGGGAITFMPISNQEGKTAAGEIDQNGNYELMTHEPGDGSMAGEFRVVINQTVEEEGEVVPDDDSERAAQTRLLVALPDRIPAIYGDAYESPLRATVEAKDLNELNFDLKRHVVDPSRPPGAMRNLDLRKSYASR